MGRRETAPTIPANGPIPIGAVIRARRWQQQMTLDELAQAVGGYRRSHLSHVETGSVQPSAELLEKIATALHLQDAAALRAATRDVVTQWTRSGPPGQARVAAPLAAPAGARRQGGFTFRSPLASAPRPRRHAGHAAVENSELRRLRDVLEQLDGLRTTVQELISEYERAGDDAN